MSPHGVCRATAPQSKPLRGPARHRYALVALLALALFAVPAPAQDPTPPLPPQSAWTLPQVVTRAFPSVVKVYGAGGFQGVPAYGSGVIVDERGFVLTAWSIALRTDALKVVTHDGQRFRAEVWRADPALGVALLRLKPPQGSLPSLGALRLGDSTTLAPGDAVATIGNPFGIIYGDELPAVSFGVVTSISSLRSGGVNVVRLPERLERAIVTDIPTNPGGQGGPLLARDGRLVGIVGRIVESRATNTIISFAVPSSDMVEFLRVGLASDKPMAEPPGVTARPARGPAIESGVRLLRVHLARPPMAYVESVVRGSPADSAGLLPDDLVFRVDDRTIRTCRDWDEVLSTRRPGDKIAVVFKRGDMMKRVELVLAAGSE